MPRGRHRPAVLLWPGGSALTKHKRLHQQTMCDPDLATAPRARADARPARAGARNRRRRRISTSRACLTSAKPTIVSSAREYRKSERAPVPPGPRPPSDARRPRACRAKNVKKAQAKVTAAVSRLPAREEPAFDPDNRDNPDYCSERKDVLKCEKAMDKESAWLACPRALSPRFPPASRWRTDPPPPRSREARKGLEQGHGHRRVDMMLIKWRHAPAGATRVQRYVQRLAWARVADASRGRVRRAAPCHDQEGQSLRSRRGRGACTRSRSRRRLRGL